jgi:hypothetical protein
LSVSTANLDHFTEVFVAQDLALLHVRAAFTHMQIRTADVGRRNPDHNIRLLLNLGVRDSVDANLLRPVVNECFPGIFLDVGMMPDLRLHALW